MPLLIAALYIVLAIRGLNATLDGIDNGEQRTELWHHLFQKVGLTTSMRTARRPSGPRCERDQR